MKYQYRKCDLLTNLLINVLFVLMKHYDLKSFSVLGLNLKIIRLSFDCKHSI